MAKKKRNASMVNRQKAFVRAIARRNRGLALSAICQLAKKKFGTLSDYYRLREAFEAAGGKVQKLAKKKAVKRKAKKTGKKKAAKKKAKRGAGRRRADRGRRPAGSAPSAPRRRRPAGGGTPPRPPAPRTPRRPDRWPSRWA